MVQLTDGRDLTESKRGRMPRGAENRLGGVISTPAGLPAPTPGSAPVPAPGSAPVEAVREGADSLLRRYRRHAFAGDALAAVLATTAAVLLRFQSPSIWYQLAPVFAPACWIGLLALFRTYETRFLAAGTQENERVVRAGLALFTLVAVASYSFTFYISRAIVLFAVPTMAFGSLLLRLVLRHRVTRARRAHRGLHRTLVVGRHDAAEALVKLLTANAAYGFEPVGVCMPEVDGLRLRDVAGVPMLGGPEEVLAAVARTGADTVTVVSHPDLSGHELRRLSWALEERQVELLVSPGIIEVAGPRLSIRPVAGLSLLHLERPALHGGKMLLKAAFDRALSLAILVPLVPALLVIGLVVRFTSPGPALFRQTRVGVDGRKFSIFKFRTMAVDAEQRLLDLSHLDEGNGVQFKLRADPRITRIGAVLRRYSLDELPQLLNVVLGHMSLVGPRPPLPSEVAGYDNDAVRRLRVRPGMTGLWQVSGRSDLSWEESLRLDLRYVDNWSMGMDLTIMWRTLRAVTRGSGAY